MRRTTTPTPDTETTEELTPAVEQEQATPDSQDTATPAVPALPVAPALQPKVRTIEELHSVRPEKMTPSEAIRYIKHLREECNKLGNQVQAYQANAEAALRKAQYYEERYNTLHSKAQSNFEYAKNAVRHCLTSIILAAKLED
jgi:hypothetical protein